MNERRIAYIDVTPELFLGVLKNHSKDLPPDTEVIRVEAEPSWGGRYGKLNVIRLFLTSTEFESIAEGSIIPRLEPVCDSRPPIPKESRPELAPRLKEKK